MTGHSLAFTNISVFAGGLPRTGLTLFESIGGREMAAGGIQEEMILFESLLEGKKSFGAHWTLLTC